MSTLTITEAVLPETDMDYPVLVNAKPTTLILVCPDQRFHLAVDGLIKNHLRLKPGEYIHLGDLGGILSLTEVRTPHAIRHAEETIRLAFKENESLENIVLVKDVSCRKYEYFHRTFGAAFAGDANDLHLRQARDLDVGERRLIRLLAPRKIRVLHFHQRWTNPEQTRIRYQRIR